MGHESGVGAPHHFARRWRRVLAVTCAWALVSAGCASSAGDTGEIADESSVVIGVVDHVASPSTEAPLPGEADNGPGVSLDPRGQKLSPRAEPAPGPGVLPPDGAPPGPALAFSSTAAGVDRTIFVLVAGSDARPGESVTRSRADSIHVVAVNPTLRRGTIIGLPRDAWVDIPDHGKGKINSALALGGPQLLARTVAGATGIDLDYYVLTGFDGLVEMTDALGGVNVFVDRRMNDKNSGARFERGWHFFHGDESLAWSRNRKDVALGDFSRSENQGRLVLAVLAKFRAEIGDGDGIRRWLAVLNAHVTLDLPAADLFSLAVTARRLDPDYVDNVVASGGVGTARGQSVVFLDDDAEALFADVATDGVIGAPGPAPTSSTAPPATTTTTTTTTPTQTDLTTTTTTSPSSTIPDRPGSPVTTAPPSTTTTTMPGSTSTSTTTTLVGIGG